VARSDARLRLAGANLAALRWPRLEIMRESVRLFDALAVAAVVTLGVLLLREGARTAGALDRSDRRALEPTACVTAG
jgi:hypothetical protein